MQLNLYASIHLHGVQKTVSLYTTTHVVRLHCYSNSGSYFVTEDSGLLGSDAVTSGVLTTFRRIVIPSSPMVRGTIVLGTPNL